MRRPIGINRLSPERARLSAGQISVTPQNLGSGKLRYEQLICAEALILQRIVRQLFSNFRVRTAPRLNNLGTAAALIL